MLRARVIRPGIVTNEKLAALGAEATLLFERLWMLADREGRIEYRPERIRAELFPYWPDFPVQNLVEKLCESGFLLTYKVRATFCIFVQKFAAHQPIHPHEAKSTLPPPPRSALRSATSNGNKNVRNVITCRDKSRNVTLLLPLPIHKSGGVISPDSSGEKVTVENPPPPPPETAPERKPPHRDSVADPRAENPSQEEPKPPRPEPIAPGFDFLRQSLHNLGREIGMPPPDDGMVDMVMRSARGANGHQIHEVLKMLFLRGKFHQMRSWGLVPVILADIFGPGRTMAALA
jgi:hypothetical protein